MNIIKTLQNFYERNFLSKAWIRREAENRFLLNTNVPIHECFAVRQFLDKRKVYKIDCPSYSSNLSPFDDMLFPK